MPQPTGVIFDLQGFSVDDGSGCRTLIFLKGCSLRCKWCANPEGQEVFPVPMFETSKCLYGAECVKVCPHHAVTLSDRTLAIDRHKCLECQGTPCVAACDPEAIRIAGYEVSVDDVMKKLQRDREYWGDRGGITITGGEPFYQHVFATELLKRCYEASILTCVETCGNVPWSSYEKALPYIDWVFLDLKHINKEKNIEGTGHDNALILANARNFAEKFPGRLIFRTVIIPGFNDSDADMGALATFLASLPREKKEINILPVHHLAQSKYQMLGKDYFSPTLDRPSEDTLKHIQGLFAAAGIVCYIGSNTPF